MTQKQLTPRQQEIKALVQEGMKVPEVALKLNISQNAVYQQLRRMRAAKPGAAKKAAAESASRAAAKKAAAPTAGAPKPAPVVETVVREQTPLQAVRARRAAIKDAVKDTADALAVANGALREAQAAYDKAQAKHADELKALDKAESALTGKPIVDGKPKTAAPKAAPVPKAPTGGNGRAKAGQPASDAGSTPSGSSAAPPAPASAPTTPPSTNGTAADDPAELARQGDAAAAAEAAEADAAAEAPQR